MTDTDAGKRLSDAELENIRVWLDDIARRYTLKDFERLRQNLPRPFLAHAPAICGDGCDVGEKGGAMSLGRAAPPHPITAKEVRSGKFDNEWEVKIGDAIAAIQQAMSECSGGACCEAGRIVFTLNEYRMANLVDALSQVPNNGDWWGETLNAISDGMKTINLHTLHSNGGRTFTQEQVEDHNISAIPLPPSPVKPGGAKVLQGLRDAIDGNFARVTIDGQVWERASPVKESRDAQKPVCGTYHSRAIGVACSNCGHLKEAHQGGDGK